MKITKSQLRQIITEELGQLIQENQNLVRFPELDETSYDPPAELHSPSEAVAQGMRPLTVAAQTAGQYIDPFVEAGLVDPSLRPWARRAELAGRLRGYDVPEMVNPYGEAAREGAEIGSAFAEPVIDALDLDPGWETTARRLGAGLGVGALAAHRGLGWDPSAQPAAAEGALEYSPEDLETNWNDSGDVRRRKKRLRQTLEKASDSQ